jgi:TnpA family transposase
MGTQLSILSPQEIHQIYGLPKLTAKQRAIYLELTLPEQELVRYYRTPLTRVYFILQLAYFKFKQQFFVFELSDVSADVTYIQKSYFPNQQLPTEGTISKPPRLQQQRVILNLLGYQIADADIRKELLDRAIHLATISANPIFVFRDLLHWMEQKKIVLPGYTIMQRMIISKAITLERQRLQGLIHQYLSKDLQTQIDALLHEKINDWYGLTWLQQETPNFNPQSLRQETKRKELLISLYPIAKSLVEKFQISTENIRYYASLADHYTVGELRQFKDGIAYLFIVCYVQYRYRQINDILVEAFKYYVRKYEAQAKGIVKEYFYKYHLDANTQLSKIPEILALFVNDAFDANTPFSIVQKQVLDLLDKGKILLLTNFINQNRVNEVAVKWQHYEVIQRQISYNLRHLFLHLDFSSNVVLSKLLKAIAVVKPILKKGKSLKKVAIEDLPIDFIPKYLQPHLYQEEKFLHSRYELMLYQALYRQLEAGHIFVENSFQNQSLEADLIPIDYWEKNNNQIIAQLGLPRLQQSPQTLLSELEDKLEKKIKEVNEAILKGTNEGVSIKNKPDGTIKWHLLYTAKATEVNHEIYKYLPMTGIIPLLHWVDEQTKFMDGFKHILNKGASQSVDKNVLIASLLAMGTNHGLADMAARSDLSYNSLKRVSQNFLRPETLQQANQIIVDATAQLPMFTHYNIKSDTLHSSSDGQKFTTRFDTVNARHSNKYFGLEKGISNLTMALNHVPVNTKTIGSNEYEGHYVLDILDSNKTSIQPTIHSTDSHGTNKVNFALLDFFGYQFAPRYKQFPKETTNLVGFKSPDAYPEKYIIKPQRQINKQRFIDQWDTCQRTIASLATKTTSQKNIVKKLSSFHRINQLQAALIDYNDLIKSIFMLDYIDSRTFRQNIQTALNRGEGYHRLRKSVAYAHDGKIQVHSRPEQQLWNECTRLICNAIIFYNTFLLSQLLEKFTDLGYHQEVAIIQKVSPIAWQHINLYGQHQFKKEPTQIDWIALLKAVKIKK